MLGKLSVSAASVFLITGPLTAGFTDCPEEFYSLVMPPGVQDFDQYGAAMASSGDWLFVSAPMDDQLETDAGAVYVFRLTEDEWKYHQKLIATGGVGPAHFGFSIAAEGESLIVGAENDREITQSNPSAWGAAYVFRLENEQWIQHQKVFGFGVGDARQFGYAAAIENDVVVIGARVIANDTAAGKGAAFVFRDIAGVLVPEQRLTADVPSLFDLFGTTLAVSDGSIVVGCSGNDGVGTNAGAAFVFSHDGAQWAQEAVLHSTTPASNDRFGEKVDMQGDTAMVSALQPDESGAVSVFRKQAGVWSATQILIASDGAPFDRFGSALDVDEDVLIVGAPNHELDSSKQAGVCYVVRRVDNAWIMERQLTLLNPETFPPINEFESPYECWLAGPPPANWPLPPALDSNRFGASAAIVQGSLFASSSLVRPLCWGETWPQNAGAVYRFDVSHPLTECFLAVGYDNCSSQPDCNGNHSPDSCDLDASTSADCNVNGVPDECDQGSAYVLPGCPGGVAVFQSGDYIWLNQHRVKPGGQFITHVSFSRSYYIPKYTPITVLLYSDPTEDGDPTDAVLLASAETTSGWIYFAGPIDHTVVSIPRTYVGPVGSFFFIGAVIRAPYANPGWNAPIACTGTGGLKRSWRAIAPPGQADIYDLANNATPISLHPNVRRWELAAVASDCNGNGIWDACDIAAGELLDIDNNGIPDSCDVPDCFFADIAPLHGDGEVNVLDLLHVITNWGVCEPCYAICPGDTNDDCATNVVDLLAVINGWGACPP
jgi:hypothetical protein